MWEVDVGHDGAQRMWVDGDGHGLQENIDVCPATYEAVEDCNTNVPRVGETVTVKTLLYGTSHAVAERGVWQQTTWGAGESTTPYKAASVRMTPESM